MPDLYLDSVSFGQGQPTVPSLVNAGVRGILCYTRVSNPPHDYLLECLANGIVISPIFETSGTRAYAGYQAGRDDGNASADDLHNNFGGMPDGVRLFVNMADTPSTPDELLGAVTDYARGFSETFPQNWLLGSYGNLAALRASQNGTRFGKLWAVETWGSPSGSVDDHWQFWLNESDVVLVQMANVGDPFGGQTDTDWLVPGRVLDAWGGPENPPTQPGFGYPLHGEMRVNSPWGPRGNGFHYGIDLWAQDGDEAIACAPMTCFYASYETDGGNHLAFYLDYPPSPAVPKVGYMHLADFAVGPGDHVELGQVVGHTDSTGAGVTGPHLHFWCGSNANTGAVDPTPFLLAGVPAPPTPKPPPNAKEASEMYIVVQTDDLTKCWLMCGNVRILDFEGPPDPQYGLPKDALAYADGGNGAHLPIRPLSAFQMVLLDGVSRAMLSAGGFPAQQ